LHTAATMAPPDEDRLGPTGPAMAVIFPHHPDRYSAVRGWPHWKVADVEGC
jgi:hypothetical protein